MIMNLWEIAGSEPSKDPKRQAYAGRSNFRTFALTPLCDLADGRQPTDRSHAQAIALVLENHPEATLHQIIFRGQVSVAGL